MVRFREPYYSEGIVTHEIGGARVRVYSIPKSIADASCNPKRVDRSVAIDCLKSALEQRKARPGDLISATNAFDVGKLMRPYLEALTSNG